MNNASYSKSKRNLSLSYPRMDIKQTIFVLFVFLLGSAGCWIIYSFFYLSASYVEAPAIISFEPAFNVCQQRVAAMNIGDKDFETVHFLPNDRRRFIARLLCTHPNSKYLEWGSGGSTELISVFPNSIEKAYSIEHAVPWCERMLEIEVVANAIKLERLVFNCVDTGQPLVMWGSPAEGANISAMRIYVDMIDNLPETHYDFVLIDGRFRVACALKLLTGNYVDDTSIVIIDDYYNRLGYSIVEKYYKILDTHEVYHGSVKAKENFIGTGRTVTLQRKELNHTMQKQLMIDFEIYVSRP